MTSMEMLKPWRLIASLIPILYAGLLIWELENSRMWILIAALALFLLLCFVSTLGYSPLLLLPAFAGTFLLLACVFALYIGMPVYDATAAARWPAEVWLAVPLALFYIGWGITIARRYAYSV